MTTYVPGKQKLFPSYVFGQNFVSKQQIDKAASCLEIFNRSVQIFSQKKRACSLGKKTLKIVPRVFLSDVKQKME
jgi:hypothetical protein